MLRNASKNAVRRGVTELAQYPKPGEKIHGFTMLRSKHVPELELTAFHLQHDKTGADYLHVAREDKNNVFSIGFKTNPPDDTGVPHILEHTTLCGSEKYPIRDPFFKMLPRTLSNFMNAFTASDHTFYPFATTNEQDFKNLMSVYMDATLHPLLKKTDFMQEGWRIGPEVPQTAGTSGDSPSEASNLVFKGVVYNEMKGQMSDAGYLFYIRFQDHIFPAINNSGGDPQKITDLTYEQLKNFHAQHYHPSNAKVFTYGDMPLADHLREIDAQLASFERIKGDLEIRKPIDLSDGPKYVTVPGPIDPLVDKDMQYKTSTSWLMGDSANILEIFSLGIMSSLLMDGYGSPLYRGLIEAGLGTEWSPNSGFDTSGRVGIFSIGLTGVKEEDVPKVKEAIHKTLEEVHTTGFDRSKIDGYLHQLELALKHKTAKFGMGLMHRIKPKWFEGVDPFESLSWNETVSAFEAELAKGGYLEGLLEKYLLNDKTLNFTMTPSATYSEELAQEEAGRLAKKIAELTDKVGEAEARAELKQRELELLKEQEKSNTQDLSCLPSVHVSDIPRQKEIIEVRDSKVNGINVQWRNAPTNGLTYFRAINVFEKLPEDLRPLIPLFTDSIMRLGTKDMTMEQLEDLMKLKTGGISVGYHATSSPTDFMSASEGLSFSGTALDRNVPEMFDLLRKLVLETDFDSAKTQSHIKQLLQASADGAVNNIAASGHAYARGYAEAALTTRGRLKEQVGGLSQVKLVTSLASRPESEGLTDIVEKLKAIQQIAFSGSSTFRTAITCGTESIRDNELSLKKFLDSLPQDGVPSTKSQALDFSRNSKTFFPLPYQVYYGSLAIPTVSYTAASGASLQILAQLLTHKHLHHEIREKGGAYGGGAYSRGLDGIFGFYSYRDPNPQNTISIMRKAGQWAADKKWTDRDLEEAKLSVFQSVDAPQAVSEEGMERFVSGVTEQMMQERRERLLDVTPEQVRSVAEEFIVNALEKGEEKIVFLGEKKPWVDNSWDIKDIGISEPTSEDMTNEAAQGI
ncbi:presequence protease-like protein [Xylogone sp. PMI_703]|nr:presequence protease-like protein [Xylogone sp. PMI_703]